jgi:ubiquinone/menaquinone biosynthesis C-methylase UbiE
MPSAAWDLYAPSYDRQLFLERRALNTLLDLIALRPGERMLDVGTGPAPLLAELAKREGARKAMRVVGLDSSAEMLARAPELPGGWELVEGDAARLPFTDASFDVVTAGYLLHILDPPEREAAIGEIARVLRSGGRAGVVTVAPPRGRLAHAATAPLRARAARSEGRLRGMRPLDPGLELGVAGLAETRRERTLLGYPSLCLTAVKVPHKNTR